MHMKCTNNRTSYHRSMQVKRTVSCTASALIVTFRLSLPVSLFVSSVVSNCCIAWSNQVNIVLGHS